MLSVEQLSTVHKAMNASVQFLESALEMDGTSQEKCIRSALHQITSAREIVRDELFTF